MYSVALLFVGDAAIAMSVCGVRCEHWLHGPVPIVQAEVLASCEVPFGLHEALVVSEALYKQDGDLLRSLVSKAALM